MLVYPSLDSPQQMGNARLVHPGVKSARGLTVGGWLLGDVSLLHRVLTCGSQGEPRVQLQDLSVFNDIS